MKLNWEGRETELGRTEGELKRMLNLIGEDVKLNWVGLKVN